MHTLQAVGHGDDIAETLKHADILRRKPFLRKLYIEFYNLFNTLTPEVPGDGYLVEVGSGPGFIKEVIPSVITSDILALPEVDRVFAADDMPFEDASVRAVFMLNTLHHIRNAGAFLKELERCLKPGGKLIAIEPANTPLSRLIFQKFHHEPFDPSAPWQFEGTSPLFSSNSALPWILFCRDRAVFEKKIPSLKIAHITLHTPFRYIISGGFTLGQLLPTFTFNSIGLLEKYLSPLNKFVALLQTIEIVKETE